MGRIRLAIVLALFCVSTFVWSDPQQDFWNDLKNRNFDTALANLTAWQSAEPDSPEVVVGFINYHFSKSMTQGLSIDEAPKTGGGQDGNKLTVEDPKTGRTYYFNNKVFYDQTEISNTMKYFDVGISRFPDRLDIRFGKIHILNQLEEYTLASKALSETLRVAAQNGCKWLWSGNKAYPKDTNGFLEDVQDYYGGWYKDGSTSALEAMEAASLDQVRYFPRHSWAYDNLALYYSVVKDSDRQLEMLLRAHELVPNDPINLSNIAYFYEMQGKIKLAVQYYKKVVDTNETGYIDQARRKVSELEK